MSESSDAIWASRWTRQVASHAPAVAVGFAVFYANSAALAVAWFAASRIAYILFAGLSLRAQDRGRALSQRDGADAAWRKFSGRCGWLMDNDAIAFIALCLVTLGTLPTSQPFWATLTAGIALAVVGIGIKVWANASLSEGSYHWRNFFIDEEKTEFAATGPYRWLSNPMYTVGYAHMYGLALGVRSAHGLVGAAFAQATILLLNHFVERPHFGEAIRRSAEAKAARAVAATPVAEPAPPVRESETAGRGGSS